jgi:hypothetical protein
MAFVAEKIIDKSDIEANKDLIEEALNLSQTTGLQVALYTNSLPTNMSMSSPRPMFRPTDGTQASSTIWKPIDIFQSLLTIRLSEIRARKKHEQEERERIEHEYWLWQNRTPSNEQWKDGKPITLEDFQNLPFKCTFQPRCGVRFATKQEADNHRWKHGG